MAVVVVHSVKVGQQQRGGVSGGHHSDIVASRTRRRPRGSGTPARRPSPANPNTAPACMHSTVFLPTTDRGRVSSTRRRAADRAAAASEDTCTPGAIAPPRNSPLAETTSTQIDDPKSTTIAALPYLWKAAEAIDDPVGPDLFRIVDQQRYPGAHTRFDQHVRYDRPVLLSISRTSCSTDGTVDRPAAPVSRSESSPIRPSMVSASSSDVTSVSVRIRQCCTTFA